MSWLLFPCSQSISYAYFIISSRILGRELICQSVISLRNAGACHYLPLPPKFCLSHFFLFVFFTFQLKLIGFFLRSATVSFFAHLTRWALVTMWSTNQLKTFGSQNLTEHPFTLILFHFFFKLFSSVLITEQETPNFSFPKLPKGFWVHLTMYLYQSGKLMYSKSASLAKWVDASDEPCCWAPKRGLLSYLVRSGWVHGDGLTLDLSLFAFL